MAQTESGNGAIGYRRILTYQPL